MNNYKEIFKLKEMLEEAEIPFIFKDCYDSYQHAHSYGYEHDLLKLMGLLTREEEAEDSVLGYCSAENVFGRIKRYWNKHQVLEEGVIC